MIGINLGRLGGVWEGMFDRRRWWRMYGPVLTRSQEGGMNVHSHRSIEEYIYSSVWLLVDRSSEALHCRVCLHSIRVASFCTRFVPITASIACQPQRQSPTDTEFQMPIPDIWCTVIWCYAMPHRKHDCAELVLSMLCVALLCVALPHLTQDCGELVS